MVSRVSAASTVLLLISTLAGCVAESRIDEYRAEAEALSKRLGAQVRDELIVGDAFVDSYLGYGVASGPVWWHVYRDYNLVDEDGASEHAATSVAAVLMDEGWSHRRVRETDEGSLIYDGYRRDEWYVELQWVVADSDMAEAISIAVTSPTTSPREDRVP